MTFNPRDDRSYYRARAETEIEAAHGAGHPVAARAHYTLAAHYLDLAHNPDSPAPGPSRPAPVEAWGPLPKRAVPTVVPESLTAQSRSG
jgi:hypothetical protein